MSASATLVLANHRPETIPLAQQLMAAHDTINLEEPADDRFHPQGRFQDEDLFAARALICSKLILKEEINADDGTCPHTRDELEVGSVIDRLSLGDCRRLYARVRRASTTESREIVKRYLESR